MRFTVLALGLFLVACARPASETDIPNAASPTDTIDATAATPTPTPPSTASREDAWIGHWVGVEGMVLDIAAADAPGRYKLTMQWDLDHHGSFDGIATSEPGIAFDRDGKRETLRATDGDATGLKYLAGKRDCLTVKPGEGYCRK